MTDLEEIILGPPKRTIEPATVYELDISTMDSAEQDKLKRSRLMSDMSLKLKMVTVNKSAFGLEIIRWASRTGRWNVTKGWWDKLWIENLPEHIVGVCRSHGASF